MRFKPFFYIFLLMGVALIIIPQTAFCELQYLNDNELSAVYAEGFASFQINDLGGGITETVARFNIQAYEYTEIDSLKLGYHDEYDYKDPTPSFGWDQDWVNVVFGTDINDPSSDFYAEGFYFSAQFENIDNAATRELKSVKFGFDYVQGDITANFISYSGTIDDSNDNTPEYNGHILNLGPVTITADPTNTGTGGFEMSLNIDNYDKGYWVTFDNAIVTP
jgi:hypothetical protein